MRRHLFALLLSIAAQSAQAQQLDQNQLTGLIANEVKEEHLILIVGDQMAGGMGAGLARMAVKQPEFKVINRFNELSGLSRPQIYDWAAAIPKIAEGKAFSQAIVWLGLNDRRDMRDGVVLVKFGSMEWDALYIKRIDALIDVLQAQNMKVVWLGMPPVSDPALDADLQNISALFSSRAAAKNITYVDLRENFVGADGAYAERGLDDTGADARLRERDGVSFMKLGNNRLGQIVLSALNETAPAQAAQAPVLAPSPPPVAPDSLDPIFGKAGDDTANAALVSIEVAAGVAVDLAAKQAAENSMIGIGAEKGSAAEALFTTGISAPAPLGRFDDFSVSK